MMNAQCSCSDPLKAHDLDQVAGYLRRIRASAGQMSFRDIRRRIRDCRRSRGIPEEPPSLATIHGYFQSGRRRLNVDTVTDIAAALGLGADKVEALKQSCRLIMDGISRSLAVTTDAAIPSPAKQFAGRLTERRYITSLIQTHSFDYGPIVIVVEGMAGSGKTELALQVCKELIANGFADDVALHANLRGRDLGEPIADPNAVLRGFLAHLGISNHRVDGVAQAERAEQYSRLLQDKRAVIFLDNAANESQLMPVLPCGSRTVVVVTSRRKLSKLARAERLCIGALTSAEAVELLERYDPSGRVVARPDLAYTLASLCGRLPLELAAIGSNLANEPDWTLADHIARLRAIPSHEASHLALAASYEHQTESARRMFRLLAIQPGPALDGEGAAALAGVSISTASSLLEELYAEHLVLRDESGRYCLDQTVRPYAKLLAHREEPLSQQRLALDRLVHHCQRSLVVNTALGQ